MHDRSEVPRASRRRAGAIDDEREKKQKKTIAKCTPATRVGVVAEVRDECLVHDPVAYARLLDDVREVVCVTHGLRLRRRDVALVRKAGPRGAGWVRRLGTGASKIVYRSVFSVKVCRTFDKNSILTLLTYAKNAKMVEKWDDKQSNEANRGAKTKMKTKKLNRQSLS